MRRRPTAYRKIRPVSRRKIPSKSAKIYQLQHVVPATFCRRQLLRLKSAPMREILLIFRPLYEYPSNSGRHRKETFFYNDYNALSQKSTNQPRSRLAKTMGKAGGKGKEKGQREANGGRISRLHIEHLRLQFVHQTCKSEDYTNIAMIYYDDCPERGAKNAKGWARTGNEGEPGRKVLPFALAGT